MIARWAQVSLVVLVVGALVSLSGCSSGAHKGAVTATSGTADSPVPPVGGMPCGSRPDDWCPSPPGDPCGQHKDTAACRADKQCKGMPYTGESVVACQDDGTGFAKNCPTVGCISR